MASLTHLLLIASVAFFSFFIRRTVSRQRSHRLPPGPKPLVPYVGNVLDLPPKDVPEFKHWLKHKDLYGPVSSINVMGRHMIIFHDKQAAQAVLGKKAQKTSARPQLNFATLAGFKDFLVTRQFDTKFRLHRKMIHKEIGTEVLSARFRSIQEKESERFVLQTFRKPENMMVYLQKLAAGTVVKIMYGYEIEREHADPLIELIEHSMENLSSALVPLSWIVDAFPAIEYLPSWFPGTSYRKTAAKFRDINELAVQTPYSFVKHQMNLKINRPSYVSSLLESASDPIDDEAIMWAAFSMYGAGSDTTLATMQSVILAFIMHPEVVAKAHEEIDRVVGSERLPSFEDRKDMPYINGIVKEAWRWNPVAPLGVAHRSEEDILHGEYLIPKGSYLLASVWWFLHDPKEYSDPDVFKPERYMSPLNERDPSDVAFGYGRRSCLGRFFADAVIYITIAHMLSVFNIRNAKDASGKDIPVKLEYITGMVNRPKPYKWAIEPRSDAHIALLQRIRSERVAEPSDSRYLKEIYGRAQGGSAS